MTFPHLPSYITLLHLHYLSPPPLLHYLTSPTLPFPTSPPTLPYFTYMGLSPPPLLHYLTSALTRPFLTSPHPYLTDYLVVIRGVPQQPSESDGVGDAAQVDEEHSGDGLDVEAVVQIAA